MGSGRVWLISSKMLDHTFPIMQQKSQDWEDSCKWKPRLCSPLYEIRSRIYEMSIKLIWHTEIRAQANWRITPPPPPLFFFKYFFFLHFVFIDITAEDRQETGWERERGSDMQQRAQTWMGPLQRGQSLCLIFWARCNYWRITGVIGLKILIGFWAEV